jgi:hypothetical protein
MGPEYAGFPIAGAGVILKKKKTVCFCETVGMGNLLNFNWTLFHFLVIFPHRQPM